MTMTELFMTQTADDGFVGFMNRLIESGWIRRIVIAFAILVLLAVLYFIYYKLKDKMVQRIEYTREFSEKGVYESEYVVMTETITNRSWLPIFFIDIESYIYNGIRLKDVEFDPKHAMQYVTSRFHLLPFMRIKRKHEVLCAKRGFYQLETIDMYYNKKIRYVNAPAELYVYPKVVPLRDEVKPSSTMPGESVTTRRLFADPFSFSGIREYRFGDPFNSVNFKATAKSGVLGAAGLRVNARDFCSNRTIMVYMNFQPDAENPVPTALYEQMMERGLSYASAIIREANYMGYRAGFEANCVLVTGEKKVSFPLGAGKLHLEEILKEMAKVRASVGVSILSLLEAGVRSDMQNIEIFLLTSYVSDEIEDQIIGFQTHGNHVQIVRLDAAGEKEEG